MIKAILLKPLDGDPEGTTREFTKADFDRLNAKGAVRAADKAKAAPPVANKMASVVKNKGTK